jgi:DNA-binding NarL/FixJ family response regulator
MEKTLYSIAVLDDHQLIAEAIKKMVEEQAGYRFAGGFANDRQWQQFLKDDATPDLLLLDINLDGEDGIVLCKQYLRAHPALRIVILTGLSQPAIIRNAMKNGAHGFMLKNMTREELWECVEKVKNGETYLHRDIEKILVHSSIDRMSAATDYIPRLSRREQEVLSLILEEKTTQEIAEALFISVNTVETHRASLLSKLGARNIAGLVRIAIEKGLTDRT